MKGDNVCTFPLLALTTLEENVQLVNHALAELLLRLVLFDEGEHVLGQCAGVSIAAREKESKLVEVYQQSDLYLSNQLSERLADLQRLQNL